MTLKIMVPYLGQAQKCGGLISVYVITHIPLDNWISDACTCSVLCIYVYTFIQIKIYFVPFLGG